MPEAVPSHFRKKGQDMRFATTLFALLAVLVIATPLAAQSANPYPEYYVERDPAATPIAYSRPDFGGKRHFWVRYWNAEARYAEDSGVLLGGLFGLAENGELDGILYDGHLLYNPNRDVGKVFFRLGEVDRYFTTDQVVDDPRLTNWWMSFAVREHKSLRTAVEEAALSQVFPDVTDAIIKHMVTTGVVDSAEVETLAGTSITSAMVKYTNSALDWNLRRTREKIGSSGLTAEKFTSLREGDRLENYWWGRYGPYPAPADILTILQIMPNGRYVGQVSGWNETIEFKWGDFAHPEFWRVKRAPPKVRGYISAN